MAALPISENVLPKLHDMRDEVHALPHFPEPAGQFDVATIADEAPCKRQRLTEVSDRTFHHGRRVARFVVRVFTLVPWKSEAPRSAQPALPVCLPCQLRSYTGCELVLHQTSELLAATPMIESDRPAPSCRACGIPAGCRSLPCASNRSEWVAPCRPSGLVELNTAQHCCGIALTWPLPDDHVVYSRGLTAAASRCMCGAPWRRRSWISFLPLRSATHDCWCDCSDVARRCSEMHKCAPSGVQP